MAATLGRLSDTPDGQPKIGRDTAYGSAHLARRTRRLSTGRRSRSTESVDVFGAAQDGTLQHWWWESGGLTGTQTWVGGSAEALSAVFWGPYRVDVFSNVGDVSPPRHW